MKIKKIGNAKILEDAIEAVQEYGDTVEFIILRSYRDTATGEKHLEYWTSPNESRIWIAGAMSYLSHKMLTTDPGENYD